MKSFIAAVIIVAVIILGGGFYTKSLDNASERLLFVSSEIKKSVSDENFTQALEKIEVLEKEIEKNYILFACFLDHSYFDKIDEYLLFLKSYTKSRDKTLSSAYADAAVLLFSQLTDGYKTKLENIL